MRAIDVNGSVNQYSETLRRIGEAMITGEPSELLAINKYHEWVDDQRGEWRLEINAMIFAMGGRHLATFHYGRANPLGEWRLLSVEAESIQWNNRAGGAR